MKLLSVVGARPQFIKAAPVSQAIRMVFHEVLVHTGQHYNREMSAVFFEELGIPEPDYNLNIGSGSHGHQTSAMLVALEDVLLEEQPNCVLVYGDTNSTLAGALSAAKLHIPLAHVEAGLRSFNREMPEEINRVVTDHCSNLLFCPTQTAVDNLALEGIRQGVHHVGDVMFDALRNFLPRIDSKRTLSELGIGGKPYVLATIHRASNTDHPDNLRKVVSCLAVSPYPVIFPIHPRTAAAIKAAGLEFSSQVRVMEPVSYLHMLALEQNAHMILTDSGGVQKEAYMLGVPCVTLRAETEWVETLATGWNTLTGLDIKKVAVALSQPRPTMAPPPLFGNGSSAESISTILQNYLS